MKTIKYITIILVFVLSFGSCTKDLDVEYLNKPDTEKVLSNPGDVYSLTKSTFYNWYMTETSSISPRMAMWVSADQGTCSWANSGMYHLSKEPRLAFDNTTSYTYAYIFESYYADMYGALSQANIGLKVIDNGMDLGEDTEMIMAFSYFMQGISLGYLGLVYDQSYIVDETTDVETVVPSPYKEVIDASIVSLEKAMEICQNNSFTVPDDWINGSSYSSDELYQLANSFAARLMVYWPRNKQENSSINWTKVLEYTNNGIQRDLAPHMDGANWKCWYKWYTVRPGWARIDCRIINLMDDRYPWRFPEDGVNPPQAQGNDKRLETDFKFVSTNNMKPERGYYHYSNYEYVRYPYDINTSFDVVDFSVTENDLIKAEAYAELGNLDQAIQIINDGTRTVRGRLSALNAASDKEKVMQAIFHERDVELIQTGFGLAFFDMRRRDMMQTGSLLHFPIPAKELMVMSMPLYTFGGVDNADGINTSDGGWFPEEQ